ncbi:MAG: DUF4430 domain-containing protein [Candidatus Wildermuthbacteria bacterium]|nr:DUF4430 domain-containing protein [Candidatus Wildermuthbacteria bacterium]
MKTKSSVAAVALAAFFLLPGLALADVQSTLYIQGPGGSVLVNTSLVVPESCTVVDNVGAPHNFSGHRAPCAIQAAKDAGIISDFSFKDFGFDIFLDRINGIVSGPAPDFPYWNLWVNGVFSEVGIGQVVLSAGDDLQLTYGPYKTGIISLAQNTPGGPVITDIYPRRVRVEEAVSFLVASQQEDGSFGPALLSDWAAIALGAYEGRSTTALAARERLEDWLAANPIPEGSVLTEYERRAMALMALGIDPYYGTDKNYIEAILQQFDGQQFGSLDLVNDDIFALLVLEKAGYEANVTPLLETLPFILSWQREDGSFGSVDLTAVAIQVISLYPQEEERDSALVRAKEYLALHQESSGGFGNVYSTSWVLQAIAALDENGDDWAMETDRRTPEHFLALRQALDGGLLQGDSRENRLWATSYAIPAALGKPWGSILGAFEKPLALFAQKSSPEDSVVPFVVQDEKAIAIASMEQQIMALQQEVAVLRQLEYVQGELNRIALEVKAVRVQVIAFRVQQLAQNMEQPRTEALAQAPQPSAAPPVAATQEPQALSQDPSLASDLSGITLVQEDTEASLAAEAKEAVGAQGFSPQLIVLLVIIGGAVFAFSGGMNNVLSLLRRTLSKV